MNTGIPSTRPYLIRAILSWCTDKGYTPYINVADSQMCRLPKKYVQGGLVTFNVGAQAAPDCVFGNHIVRFCATFGGVVEDITIPIGRVVAVYAKENGQGLHFSPEDDPVSDVEAMVAEEKEVSKKNIAPAKKSWLRIVK